MRNVKMMGMGLLTGAVLALTANASIAASVTYDFTGSDTGFQDSLTYSAGGIDLTVTAFDTGLDPSAEIGAALAVGDVAGGLEARSHLGDTSNQIDSHSDEESILFSFSEQVNISSISFSYFKNNRDGVNLLADTGSGLSIVETGVAVANYVPGSIISTDLFAIGAQDLWRCTSKGCKFRASSFKITSLTIDTIELSNTTGPSIVPLPAGGVLLLSGLGLLGLARRRRQSV